MDKIDFIELATFCVNRYKVAHTNNRNIYDGTLYVAILEDNQVLCSRTPHVLKNAEKCLLIHQHSKLAISNYYSWYNVEFIDEKGCVFDGNLGNGFKLDVCPLNQFSNQMMRLLYNQSELFWCEPPFEAHIAKVWELYTRLKDIQTMREICLIAELYRKDEKILELEKEVKDFSYTNQLLKQERDQYKELLDEIKEMVDK